MTTISAFAAKTRFGELLDRVERGEEIVITRHDRSIARISPLVEKPDLARVRQAVAALRKIGREHRLNPPGLPKTTYRELINEGRPE